MGYKKRQWWPGSILHVTARGNHKDNIFRCKKDFQMYCTYLEEALEYFRGNFEIYGYCLMNNHVHLLIKTDELHISHFITRIHSIYARFFNQKYKCTGHLFQDRYFTEVVEDDGQLLSTIRYIHLNPVKASMVKDPADYNWSSYGMTIGVIEEKLINSSEILGYFKSKNSRKAYKSFVNEELTIKKDA